MEKEKSYFIHILVTQIICCAILLISVLTFKYLFKEEYKEIRSFFETQICVDTKVQEVLE